MVQNAFGTAFVINPVKIKSDSPIQMEVLEEVAGLEPSMPGATFDIFAVDPDTATVELVGSAQRDDVGIIASSPMTLLTDVSVLILVRQANDGFPPMAPPSE